MLLEVNSIKKEYGGHVVLDNVSFTIGDKEVAALVGENGSGKTTLLKILAGLEEADSGSVHLQPKDLVISYVPQALDEENLDLTPLEMGVAALSLAKLEISDLMNVRFGDLSSGERTKVYLARLITSDLKTSGVSPRMKIVPAKGGTPTVVGAKDDRIPRASARGAFISQKADLLLLDEPTNHLDIETLEWLENYLLEYDGSILLVSHDRRFLDNLSQKTLEIKGGKIKIYGGNYSFYRFQKEVEAEAERRAFIVQQKKVKRIEGEIKTIKTSVQSLERGTSGTDHYVRRKAAKAARGALSMEKRLEKELAGSDVKKPEADIELSAIFKPKIESSKTVVYLKGVTKSYSDRGILKPFDLLIEKGEKVALLGVNGSGKTTIIKLILGELIPDTGRVEIGNNVKVGYLPQEQAVIASSFPLIEELMARTDLDKSSVYKLARKFLFKDEDLLTRVCQLSSGQKSRLALAKIMASGANFIILDEPTNHLDIPSREALEKAIVSYSGTLLVVSHDRYFLETIKPDRIVYL